MAESDLSGFQGSVTLPTAHAGGAYGFTIRRQMVTKRTDRYGAGDRFARRRGGIIDVGGDINVFLRKGAAATSPGIVVPAVDGAVLTLTLDTGCLISGTALFPDLNIAHNFGDPAIEGTYSYEMNGTVTETWATS